MKDNVQIFLQINQATSTVWSEEIFNFSGFNTFEFTGPTTFEFELLAYAPVGNGYSDNIWDLDDISVEGCCTTPFCDNVTDGGQIGNDESGCAPFDPSFLASFVDPSGGSNALEIIWLESTDCNLPISQWTIISGATALGYDPPAINQTTCYIRCSRRAGCNDYIGESNIVTKTVVNGPALSFTSTDPTCGNTDGTASVSVAATSCTYTVSLYDTYGDGWSYNGNTNVLSIFVNGVAVLSNITLTGGNGPENYTFNVSNGDVITTTYQNNDWYGYENYYYIYDDANNLFYSAGCGGNGCAPPSSSMAGTASCNGSGGPYTYTWSNGATTSSISGLSDGTYTVTVTDGSAVCDGIGSVTLNPPTGCCDNVTDGGQICCDQSNCGPFDPSIILSPTDPSGGSGALEIIWLSSTNCSLPISQWNTIAGATGLTYDPGVVSQTTCFIRCSRRAGCTDYIGESNIVTMTVDLACPCDLDTIPPTAFNLTFETTIACNQGFPHITFVDNESFATIVNYAEYSTEEVCEIDLSSYSAYSTYNIWFHAFPTQYDKHFIWENGYVTVLPDNTMRFFGRVRHINHTGSGFYIDIYSEPLVDFNTWIAGGGDDPGDPDRFSRRYAEVDFTKPNSIVGFGEFANSNLALLQNVGYQYMDIGPRDVYGGYGAGCWIEYGGTVNGMPAGNSTTDPTNHLDMYAALNNCAYNQSGCEGMTTREWEVADSCGNTQTFVQNIHHPLSCDLNVNVTSTGLDCFGVNDGTATANPTGGSAPYSYLWSNGATTQSISNLSIGTYTVTVTDDNTCQVSGSVTLAQPPGFNLNFSHNDASCNGVCDASIDLTLSGGTPPYTFQWSNGATTEDISGLCTGNYTITIDDANGCRAVILSDNISEPTALVTSTTAINSTCAEECDGSIDLTVSGGTPPYSYLWSNGATSEDVSNLCEGTHNVTITDANGCTAVEGQLLTDPDELIVSVTGNDIDCHGNSTGSASASVSGGTGAYSYSWSSGQTVQSISNLAAGNYTVTVTDGNGCLAIGNVNIDEPDALAASISVSNATCNGFCDGFINLTLVGGTAPFSYSWSNGETTEDVGSLCAGVYAVTITDANGCSISANDSVNEPGPLTPGPITPSNTQVCEGSNSETFVVNSVPGASYYSWTIPPGVTIIAGQGTTSITVSWGSSGGDVCVTPSNSTCTGGQSCISVTVRYRPEPPEFKNQ